MNVERPDPILDALAALPAVTPDAGHACRVRERCQTILEREPAPTSLPFEPAAAWALCASYAWLIARLAALIGGVRQP